MEFRIDFTFRIFMDIFYYFVNIMVFKLIYRHTDLLGGWNENQILIFIATYLVVDAIYMTFVSNNLWYLPHLINKGELDYYLVRPVSPFFFVTFREFAFNSFVNLLMAVGILAWAIYHAPVPANIFNITLLVILIINGSVLYFLSNISFIIPIFWTHSGRGLGVLWFSFAKFIERPDRIYTGFIRVILTTILPFLIMASFPAKLFLEGFHWPTLLHIILTSVGFCWLVSIFWRFGLRGYSSASS